MSWSDAGAGGGRVLLVQNAPYFPFYAGASKSDHLLMAALVRRGYRCAVVARADESGDLLRRLEQRRLACTVDTDGTVAFTLDGVDIHVVSSPHLRASAVAAVEAFRADVVLASTDPLNVLIEDLVRARVANLVYIARTTTLLPFGPHAAFPSRTRAAAIGQARVVIAVSEYLAAYIAEHSGIPAHHVPIQLIDEGDWRDLGNFGNRFVTMVNPCALKGIVIFLALADAFPDVEFAAVPTWGTTAHDLADLAARPNVRILEPVDDIREILRQTRIMLAPSLWPEARGRMIVESMLSGVPILVSNVGGIPEAALGIPCVLPVNPIVAYNRGCDEHGIRLPETPPQDVGPWRAALSQLLSDPGYYATMATASREAAQRYADALDVAPFESVVANMIVTIRHTAGKVGPLECTGR